MCSNIHAIIAVIEHAEKNNYQHVMTLPPPANVAADLRRAEGLHDPHHQLRVVQLGGEGADLGEESTLLYNLSYSLSYSPPT
jgi:hypothetical protein